MSPNKLFEERRVISITAGVQVETGLNFQSNSAEIQRGILRGKDFNFQSNSVEIQHGILRGKESKFQSNSIEIQELNLKTGRAIAPLSNWTYLALDWLLE